MDHKSKNPTIKTKLHVILLAMMPVMASANDQCVLQDRVVSRSEVVIAERTPVRRDVVTMPNGNKKCIVDFKVRVGADWHTAFGEYEWPGDRSSADACGIAAQRGEDLVRQRVGRSQTASEKILVCKDRPELTTLRNTTVGTVGDAGQFRPHPQYLHRFWHNGAQCRWFIEPAFTGRDIQTFQGIVCEVQSGKWIVVDKF